MVGPSNGISQILRIYRQEKVEAANRAARPAGASGRDKDELVISNEARVLAVAQQAVREAPEVRADRVAALRAAIEKGAYRVPGERLAEAVLEHLRGEKV
ncbi:MAG: flagellar biosynthesis anti-sigma factor FlgM [Syntrophomonadaceae bacterium]|nr:flagellar biosynthesis anti-sigma factor FlgM [Syntrophomonadaceae bacterium]